MLEKIKGYLMTSMGFYTILFVVVYLSGWFYNATHGTKFDLNQLKDLYLFVAGQLTVKYGIDSGLNSKIGESIQKGGQTK